MTRRIALIVFARRVAFHAGQFHRASNGRAGFVVCPAVNDDEPPMPVPA